MSSNSTLAKEESRCLIDVKSFDFDGWKSSQADVKERAPAQGGDEDKTQACQV